MPSPAIVGDIIVFLGCPSVHPSVICPSVRRLLTSIMRENQLNHQCIAR